jgi:hypothetical protein
VRLLGPIVAVVRRRVAPHLSAYRARVSVEQSRNVDLRISAHAVCRYAVSFLLGELAIASHVCNLCPGRWRGRQVSPLPTFLPGVLHLLCESARRKMSNSTDENGFSQGRRSVIAGGVASIASLSLPLAGIPTLSQAQRVRARPLTTQERQA